MIIHNLVENINQIVPLVLQIGKEMYTTPNVGEVVRITSSIIGDALNDLFF